MPPAVTHLAPAKLNLALSVGPPDGAGLHPICSWMVTVDLHDELTLTRLELDRLSRYAILWHDEALRRSEIDWSITRDLAVRAHLALEAHTGRRLPVQLKLAKRIPVGGGLGGGSSDAAAMLRAVNDLFELGLSLAELGAIGATLGADVPFLVRGGSAIVRGTGEQVEPHGGLPRLSVVLAFPDLVCPTGAVYGAFDELGGAALRAEHVESLAAPAAHLVEAARLFNDLAPAASHLFPQLADDLGRLADLAERPAHLCGSGASIFVLCDDEIHAAALAEAVTQRLGLPAVAATTVGVGVGLEA